MTLAKNTGTGVRIYYVPTADRFMNHEVCAPAPDEWIKDVIATSNSGSGRSVPGAGSFHPKAPDNRRSPTR